MPYIIGHEILSPKNISFTFIESLKLKKKKKFTKYKRKFFHEIQCNEHCMEAVCYIILLQISYSF